MFPRTQRSGKRIQEQKLFLNGWHTFRAFHSGLRARNLGERKPQKSNQPVKIEKHPGEKTDRLTSYYALSDMFNGPDFFRTLPSAKEIKRMLWRHRTSHNSITNCLQKPKASQLQQLLSHTCGQCSQPFCQLLLQGLLRHWNARRGLVSQLVAIQRVPKELKNHKATRYCRSCALTQCVCFRGRNGLSQRWSHGFYKELGIKRPNLHAPLFRAWVLISQQDLKPCWWETPGALIANQPSSRY